MPIKTIDYLEEKLKTRREREKEKIQQIKSQPINYPPLSTLSNRKEDNFDDSAKILQKKVLKKK